MIALSKLTGAGDTSSCQLFYQQLWLGGIKYALSAQCVMQKYAADMADGLIENIAFYWEVGDLLVPLHYNHVLLLQCVCNPADEPAVKVKNSIIEMNMAHVIFNFLYYDIPGPGRDAVIPTDIKFREFGFQIGQQELCIVCIINAQ